MLYTYNTLNKEYFKSGRYVEFEAYPSEITTNISKYLKEGTKLVYVPKFYKVKLLHQLNNGYLDLTKDVWVKFTNVLRTTAFWFSNPSFIYYCPSQYKGKLVSSLEIEDLYKFSLFGLPEISLNNDMSYKFSVSVDALAQNSNDSSIKIDTGVITIPQLRLETWFDDPTVVTTKYERTASLYSPIAIYTIGDIVFDDNRDYYKNLTGVNSSDLLDSNWEPYPEYMSVDNIDSSKANTLINYRITPVLGTLGNSALYEGTTKNGVPKDLPDEFIEKYSIVGSRRISTEYDNITFKKVNNNYGCDLTRGVKIYNEYILTNSIGLYLDNNLEISEIPYIFLRQGTASQTPNSVIINSYNVVNKKPDLIFPAVTVIDDFILELFKITEVEENSLDCVQVTYQTLNINFNINMSPLTQVKMYQDGELIYSLTNVSLPGVYALIASNKSTTIQVTRPGYHNISQTIGPISEETTVNLAFIANVAISSNIDTYKLVWKGQGENLPSFTTSIEYNLDTNGTPHYYLAQLFSWSAVLMETPSFDVATYGSLYGATLTQSGIVDVPSGLYLNVVFGQCATYEGTIFNKIINW